MKPTECGTCHPPADGTRDREQLDRFAEFLRLVGGPARRDDDGHVIAGTGPTWFGRWLVANDPEMRGYVHGAFPLTIDDVR